MNQGEFIEAASLLALVTRCERFTPEDNDSRLAVEVAASEIKLER